MQVKTHNTINRPTGTQSSAVDLVDTRNSSQNMQKP